MNYSSNLISEKDTIQEALTLLNSLTTELTLFVINDKKKILGTLTDGDIRRGLLSGLNISSPITQCMNQSFRFIEKSNLTFSRIDSLKTQGIKLLPIIENGVLIEIFNLTTLKAYLPVDVVIMAGGQGQRLRPLTENIPKPLLPIGEKPILEHLINHLVKFGVKNIHISLNYLGDQIVDYFGDGSSRGININYLKEKVRMGTAGALSSYNPPENDTILMINSDILTDIDFSRFYKFFIDTNSDICVAGIPYEVKIPYAVLTLENNFIQSIEEKPVYTYFSNGGIYLINADLINNIPKDQKYDATDFIEDSLRENLKVSSYPVTDYWLDIGRHDDYLRAQKDISALNI